MSRTEVPVLLVNGGVGRVAHISIRHIRASRYQLDEQLRPSAASAVRDAFCAAAALAEHGQPRWPLARHEITVRGMALDQIDGGSLGLPLALAFLSLWTGSCAPSGVAATGVVTPRGDVGRVGSVPSKVAAWRDMGGTRVLVPASGDPFDAPGVEAVATLAEAWRAWAGAPLRFDSDLGIRGARLRRIRTLCDHVVEQDLAEHIGGGVNPWALIADELRFLLAATPRDGALDTDRLLGKARCYTALAYTHIGELSWVKQLLGGEPPAADADPLVRTLWHLVELNQAIDDPSKSDLQPRIDALEAISREARDFDAALLRGQILGTQGRALLHRRRPGAALPLLEQAAEWHQSYVPNEAGRSWNYVAMARRAMCDFAGAAEASDQASALLESETKPLNEHLYHSTMVFWRYERSRIELALGNEDNARAHANAALRGCVEHRMHWWPEIGILRVLAWLDPANPEAQAARIGACARACPWSLPWLTESILQDVHRGPDEGQAEVY